MTTQNQNVDVLAPLARKAALKLAAMNTKDKNELLLSIAQAIKNNKARILEANLQDTKAAQAMVDRGELSKALFNRLLMSDEKIDQLGTYLEEVAKLDDPVGKRQFAMRLDHGLELERVSCPIGVIAVIFESRPEVVIQVSALSLKSSNAVILKGGSEAAHSNRVLFELIHEALKAKGLEGAVSLIETRQDVSEILKQDRYIDLIIPRGSNEFVRYIQDNSRIPVLGHSAGICHLYLDPGADPKQAIELSLDSKLDYPSACNAVETLLIHRDFPAQAAQKLFKALLEKEIQLKGCEKTQALAKSAGLMIETANEADWETEYSDLVLSVKIVDSLEEAIEHINQFGSHHTDCIVTQDKKRAETFLAHVDSACVFHNASTRFSDGYVFGLGAEVGISTNKTHSRGPVGLDGMVIYKYLLRGQGQCKGDYSGKKAKAFLHQPML